MKRNLLVFVVLLSLLLVFTAKMQANSESVPAPTAVVEPTTAPTPDPEAALPPPRDEKDIPFCQWAEGDELVEVTAEMAAVNDKIDYAAPAACRLRSTPMVIWRKSQVCIKKIEI